MTLARSLKAKWHIVCLSVEAKTNMSSRNAPVTEFRWRSFSVFFTSYLYCLLYWLPPIFSGIRSCFGGWDSLLLSLLEHAVPYFHLQQPHNVSLGVLVSVEVQNKKNKTKTKSNNFGSITYLVF